MAKAQPLNFEGRAVLNNFMLINVALIQVMRRAGSCARCDGLDIAAQLFFKLQLWYFWGSAITPCCHRGLCQLSFCHHGFVCRQLLLLTRLRSILRHSTAMHMLGATGNPVGEHTTPDDVS